MTKKISFSSIILIFSFCSLSQTPVPFKKDGKWGYKNGLDITVIEPIYDTACTFWHNAAIVGKGGKFGYIDNDGNPISEIKYDHCSTFNGDHANVQLNGKYGIINLKGEEVISISYDKLDWSYYSDYVTVCRDNKWGLITWNEKVVFPIEYEQAIYGSEGLFAVKKNGKFGFINKKGETVIPFMYYDAENFFQNLAVVSNDTAYGMINKLNQQVIPLKYEYVHETDKNLVLVQEISRANEQNLRDSYYGVYNKQGVELSSPVYTDFFELYGGSLILVRDSIYNLVDGEFNLLLDGDFSKIAESDEFYNCVYFEENGKKGLYEYEKNILIVDALYEDILAFSDFYALLKDGNRYGILDIENRNVIIKPVYHSVEEFEYGYFICTTDDKRCVINRNGQIILPAGIYSEIWLESDKIIAAINEKEETIYYNMSGEQILKK